jgi:hypothetical protein
MGPATPALLGGRAPVAQWIEQPPPKRKVASSTLAWGTDPAGWSVGASAPQVPETAARSAGMWRSNQATVRATASLTAGKSPTTWPSSG